MTDAITQARANVHLDLTMSTEADIDALIAAVRAETLREVRGELEKVSRYALPRIRFDGWGAVCLALTERIDALAQPEGTDPKEFTGLQATQPSGENVKVWVYREPEDE